MGRGKPGSLGGPAGPVPTCCPTHRKVYLATLLFSSTVRSARSPGWRMETRTLLTVECLSRWRAHCTVMALAVTFMISKPSTGRGPSQSKRRGLWSATGHRGEPHPFPTLLHGGPACRSGLTSSAGTDRCHPAGIVLSCPPWEVQVGGRYTHLPARKASCHALHPWGCPPLAPAPHRQLQRGYSTCTWPTARSGNHPEPGSPCPWHLPWLKAS